MNVFTAIAARAREAGSTSGVVLRNTAWIGSERLLALVLGFAVAMLAARLLGPESYGRFGYYLSYVSIFLPLMNLGLDRILMREMNQHPENVASILFTAFLARMAASVLVVLAGLLILQIFDQSIYSLVLVSILFMGQSFQCFRVYNIWFQHRSRNQVIVRFRALCLVLGATAKIILLFLSADLTHFIAVTAIEQCVLNGGHFMVFRREAKAVDRDHGQFDIQRLKHMLEQSRYLIMSGFAYLIYVRLDTIMLARMVGDSEAGIYFVAARITEACQILPEALLVGLFPGMLALHQKNQAAYLEQVGMLFRLLFAVGLAVAAAVFFLAPWIIPLIFSDAYIPSVDVIQIQVWACGFLYMRTMLSHWLVAERFAQFSLFSHLLGAIVNVILNLILIPRYGAVGAAYATVASIFASTYICLPFHARTRPLFFLASRAINIPGTLWIIAQKMLPRGRADG